MVLRSTRLRRSRIVCVRAPSQHTPKTPWMEEVVSFSLDDDARRRRREANARRRPDGTATNAYIARARVMGGKFVHREPTRWMRTMTESVELGRRFDSRARRRRVRRRRRRSRSSAGKRRAARTEDPRNMGTHTFLNCGPNGAMTTFSFAYDADEDEIHNEYACAVARNGGPAGADAMPPSVEKATEHKHSGRIKILDDESGNASERGVGFFPGSKNTQATRASQHYRVHWVNRRR